MSNAASRRTARTSPVVIPVYWIGSSITVAGTVGTAVSVTVDGCAGGVVVPVEGSGEVDGDGSAVELGDGSAVGDALSEGSTGKSDEPPEGTGDGETVEGIHTRPPSERERKPRARERRQGRTVPNRGETGNHPANTQ